MGRACPGGRRWLFCCTWGRSGRCPQEAAWGEDVAGFLVDVLDDFAFGVAGAAEEGTEAADAFDHGFAAGGAFVFGDFELDGFAFAVDVHGAFALGVARAGEESFAAFGETVGHHGAAGGALVFGGDLFGAGVGHARFGGREVALQRGVEILDDVDPVFLGFFNLIEFGLDCAGETGFHDIGETFDEFLGDLHAQVAGIERAALRFDVLTILNGCDD